MDTKHSTVDFPAKVEDAIAGEDRAFAGIAALKIAAAWAHLPRAHCLLVETSRPERRQRAMRRSRHRILGHAVMWREVARDEIITRIALGGDDQPFILGNEAREIAWSADGANGGGIVEQREDVSAGMKLRRGNCAQRLPDVSCTLRFVE